MRTTKTRLLGWLLLAVAIDSHALTLGRMRGAALLGQGLDVTVQVQTDPDESASSLCLEADVFHADTRQDPGRVQLTFDAPAAGQPVTVRIVSASAIDEPVVTVYLRAGCAQKTTRRYVLLSDIATELLASVPSRSGQLALVVPPAAPAGTAPLVSPNVAVAQTRAGETSAPPSGAAGVASTKPVAPARKRAASAPRKPAAAKSAAAVVSAPLAPAVSEKLQAGRSAGQSRLKLDPIEVLTERVATLESSTANVPNELAAREAQESQRLKALEDNVKSLVALASKNEASLLDLRTRLQQAESERYSNPLIYVLALLLLASLASIAVLLARRGRAASGTAGNWWNASPAMEKARPPEAMATTGRATVTSGFAPVSAPVPVSVQDSQPTPLEQSRAGGPRSRPAPITQVDVSLVEMSESTFDRLMQSGATHSAVRKAKETQGQPVAGTVLPANGRRLINSDELFDIRQQAEFFVSLGQTDQAVRILENRISESGESSPLAYLDLLKIFHSLGLKADFRQVREDFNLLFNARLPDFAGFGDEGRDLESYPAVMEQIEAVWGTPQAPALLESLVFREQWNSEREVFDTAAFRDLLLLHAVAQAADSLADELVVPVAASIARSVPPARFGPSLPAGAGPTAATDAPLPQLDGVSDVDIDLSDPGLSANNSSAAANTGSLPSALDDLIQFDLPGADAPGAPKRGA